MAPATDEIYEKYRDKAILEINALADEIGRAANGRAPVLGSGHPLGDVLLLKYRPQPSEVQEGVAFFGRAGQAILKSLQRLHVDPMSVYGTNCLKFADGDDEESRPWLARELHIVQPKLVVPMGEEAVTFLNAVEFPLADPTQPFGAFDPGFDVDRVREDAHVSGSRSTCYRGRACGVADREHIRCAADQRRNDRAFQDPPPRRPRIEVVALD